MRWVVWLWLCTGCGRLAFEELPDSRMDAPCTLGSFSAPLRLPGPVQSTVDDWLPHSALGSTQIYFCSYRTPSTICDIWYATRTDTMSPFSAPIQITELATAAYEGGPSVTEDALDMVFYQDDGNSYNLLETTRDTIAAPWRTPILLAINTSSVESYPSLSPDGLRLVFASDRSGALGATDIWETSRASRASPWQTPIHHQELSTPQTDGGPTLSADGLEIFFASSRPGGVGLLDIYTARRASVEVPFEPPVHVPQLASANDDTAPSLSADGLTMFFNYDTLVAGGRQSDLWVSTRTCD